MMRILITGASGFIGSFVVERALELGWEVWAGVRPSSSRVFLQDPRIRFVDLDFGRPGRLAEQLRGCRELFGAWDYVVHCAGATKCVRPDDFERVNYGFCRNLVEGLLAADMAPKKFLLMSSLSAHHPGVSSLYGASKRMAEDFLCAEKGLSSVALCPTGVYGPRDRDYWLSLRLMSRGWALTAGFEPQVLSFIYVGDLVRAVFLALERPTAHPIYTLSDGAVYSDRQFLDLAQRALGRGRVVRCRAPLWVLWGVSCLAEGAGRLRGRASTLNRDKFEIMRQRDWTCNNTLIARDLDFVPEYSLERGLAETVAWYRAAGWL
jgi:nucleoside-diphosphate-sugar epimerase